MTKSTFRMSFRSSSGSIASCRSSALAKSLSATSPSCRLDLAENRNLWVVVGKSRLLDSSWAVEMPLSSTWSVMVVSGTNMGLEWYSIEGPNIAENSLDHANMNVPRGHKDKR